MQLELFPALERQPEELWHPPLVTVPGSTWRIDIRVLWNPLAQRGVVAGELTDDDTRELLAWLLLPGAHSIQELSQHLRKVMEHQMDRLGYLDEPF